MTPTRKLGCMGMSWKCIEKPYAAVVMFFFAAFCHASIPSTSL
ncbi:MAG: hypothetical protein QW222_07990 [Candidatus Bathyarchaeia archaeon]